MRPTCPVFVFRAQLQDVEPPIWRRFEASGSLSLPALHDALQAGFGWENCHLHEFRTGQVSFGQTGRDFDAPSSLIDESTIRLVQLVRDAGDSIEYAYDFGDGWELRLL